eukprot:CAMPEP_0203992684 /NCGR_PEP_ID=MMETSP0360-20130528/10253_1 /ASSEMBLY_ACC=CAM_ASM_000342 /TAXON_ID=268821 /ORGANISM="Scrippsiella Hangoei, Strain SHTV-5" /LENGTH=98 /DNA_ID=CAMNT_0050933027 /DNA_START=185 /DNA_END=482 /DNA_ORIENTATION=-
MPVHTPERRLPRWSGLPALPRLLLEAEDTGPQPGDGMLQAAVVPDAVRGGQAQVGFADIQGGIFAESGKNLQGLIEALFEQKLSDKTGAGCGDDHARP